MTEQKPESDTTLTTDGQEREFVSEGGDQSELVDEDGDTRVSKVPGDDEFTTDQQSAVTSEDADVAMPRPGGLVQ